MESPHNHPLPHPQRQPHNSLAPPPPTLAPVQIPVCNAHTWMTDDAGQTEMHLPGQNPLPCNDNKFHTLLTIPQSFSLASHLILLSHSNVSLSKQNLSGLRLGLNIFGVVWKKHRLERWNSGILYLIQSQLWPFRNLGNLNCLILFLIRSRLRPIET